MFCFEKQMSKKFRENTRYPIKIFFYWKKKGEKA